MRVWGWVGPAAVGGLTLRACAGVEDYYHADDFRVGQRMNVLGRDMLIYDADEFTFDWCG